MINISVVKQLMIRAGADFSSMRKEMSKAQSTVKGFASNVGGMLKKLAMAFAAVFAVRKMIEFGKASKSAADEMDTMEAKLAVVMRQTMDASDEAIQSIKDLITAQEAVGVVDVVAQTSAAQELATYLSEVKSMKKILPTLNDLIAQQYGMSASAEQATGMATMLGKVLDGQTGALKRYGFSFSESEEKILKYGDEASRVALVADIVRGSIGNMNTELGKTPQGQWKQIQYTFDAIKIEIGRGLTPVLQALLPYIMAVANAFLKAAQTANAFMNALFGTKNQITTTAAQSAAVDDVGDSYEEAGKKAKKAASSVASFDEVNTLSSGSSGDDDSVGEYKSSAGGLDLSKINDSTISISEKIQAMADKVKKAFSDMANDKNVKKLADAYGQLKDSFKNLSNSIDDFFNNPNVKKVMEWMGKLLGEKFINARISDMKIISGIFDGWAGAFKTLNGLFSLDFSKMLEGIKEWGAGIAKTFEGVIDIVFPNFVEKTKTWWTKVRTTTTEKWKEIKTEVSEAWDEIKKSITWEAFTAGVSNGWKAIKDKTREEWESIKIAVSTIWDSFLIFIKWDSIKILVSNLWKDIRTISGIEWNAIKQMVSDIWDSFLTFIKWDAIKTVVSNLWRDIKIVASAEWEAIKQVVSKIWDSFKTSIKWDDLFSTISAKWDAIKTDASAKWVELKQIIHDKWNDITKIDFNGIKNGLLGIWNDLSIKTGTVWDGIGKTIKDSINSVIDIINGFITQVNSIKIDIPKVEVGGIKMGGGSIGMPKIPAIPRLAKGGITNGEMLATIGDNPGGQEVVSPLSDLLGMINSSVSAALANQQGNGNKQGDIVLQIDGVAFARITNALNAKESTRIGGSMITTT